MKKYVCLVSIVVIGLLLVIGTPKKGVAQPYTLTVIPAGSGFGKVTSSPAGINCAKCFSKNMDWFEMPKKGRLETFTTAYYAPFGFEADPPYTMGVVDFGDGLKLFARVAKDIKSEDVKVGMQVTIRPLKYDDDQLSFEITKA